ncbi:ABC transporter ATP-binding protein [Oceanobacillus jeddahense]|uniref:ABC transporter ATP-binding protein n=1 Tax=Oceanobacillus jeddahense TaxID=1462527 RepID=UPI0005961FB2|nr:ABC transporter ATP-binding protein [Oceanobacillus jeddahense]
MSNLLEVRNVSKSFGKEEFVLNNISLDVPEGSIVGFIGDNGSGKSTTFKSILELIRKDSGQVRILGKESLKKHVELKEQIGVVFDAMNLPANLTIKQLNKVFINMFDNWNQESFERLLQSFNLPLNKKVEEFSRGMSMKLSVAVALSHNALLLLLDEATGGLDPSSREALLDELKGFVDQNKGGILLSSHITSDVEKIADQLVFIKDGEIILNVEKETMLREYGVVEVDKEQLASLESDMIVAKRIMGEFINVLISNKDKLPYGIKEREFSFEEISVLLTRSDKE